MSDIQEIWDKYQEALEEEADAASLASMLAEELRNEGIDPDNPPEYLA
ncbi:MAG: hypothetical protein ACXAB9_11320 [Candidatus Thorarchaeota archaeon]|jgi:hypothetical protein